VADREEVRVPDIGDFDSVDISEVLVSAGDHVAEGDSLIALESDKASMEVPAPFAGVVVELRVGEGDQVGEGSVIALMERAEGSDQASDASEEPAREEKQAAEPEPEEEKEEDAAASAPAAPEKETKQPKWPASKPPELPPKPDNPAELPHASPSVRRFARELGVDLARVSGSGRKGRITADDVKGFVKKSIGQSGGNTVTAGSGLPEMPSVDFSKFGEVETQPLERIRKLSAKSLHRSWVLVPHVTQHDEADITEMEAFRKSIKDEAAAEGYRLTPLTFLMKALVASMKAYPRFNSSLSADGESLIVKKFYHIGIAVDTPNGLVVPVIRDVDQKSIYDLAAELSEVSGRARDGKLTPKDISGACITISSLGGIGGTAFTPIVNAPEVAILGVSRSAMKPVWNGSEFVPRLMLPLSLSYDHRVIDGADAARFTTHYARVLGDLRRLLL